jgi:hypothetical protein
VHTGFSRGNLREGNHLKDPGLGGRIILKWILKKWDGRMNWIDLAHDTDRWRALRNAAISIRGP